MVPEVAIQVSKAGKQPTVLFSCDTHESQQQYGTIILMVQYWYAYLGSSLVELKTHLARRQ